MSSHARTLRIRRLAEREAVLSEQEHALLARRDELDDPARALLDASVDLDAMLDAREAAAATRGAVLLAWSAHLEAAERARVQARTPSEGPLPAAPEFWGALGAHLSTVLSAEIGELQRDEVRAAVDRAISALGGSAPPQAQPPPELDPVGLTAPSHTAMAEEAELLAGMKTPPPIELALGGLLPTETPRPTPFEAQDLGFRMTEEFELPGRVDAFYAPPPPAPSTPLEEDPFANLQASLAEFDALLDEETPAPAPPSASSAPTQHEAAPPRVATTHSAPPAPIPTEVAFDDPNFDPFADLAAELEALAPDEPLSALRPQTDPSPGSAEAEIDSAVLEPIPGYDAAEPVSAASPAPASPRPAAPMASVSPADPFADRFRPTRGRLAGAAPQRDDSPVNSTLPRPAPTPPKRSAATFSAFAEELSSGLRDPWSELDISDYTQAGHPGPLPQGRASHAPSAAAHPRAPDDRPREFRAGLSAKVGIEHGNHFFTGFTGNVSRGGLFVSTSNTLPLNARVEVFFEMPDGHSISAPADVCWQRPAEQAAIEGLPAGLGLRFASLSHDDEIALERFIASQEHPSQFGL